MIIATAGHVDHGKTLLVKALTGTDTDRLPEEKKRNLTIDLGFAYLPAGDAETIGFIDVPGHERFVRNALCGLAGTDFVLFIIAADDGPMPQSVEHLAIVDLLGIQRGAVALTKIDRVSERRRSEVTDEVAALISGTTLAGAPVYPVSAMTGDGIEDLAAHLQEAAANTPRRQADNNFRLAIDRRFDISGAGLVATGTVFSGGVNVADSVEILGADMTLRVRGIHAQNAQSDTGRAGQRCAINLAGPQLRKDRIARGDWVVSGNVPPPVRKLDGELRVLANEARALNHWTPVHVHLAAAETTGRVAILEAKSIAPGASGLVQLVLDHPIGAVFGDRFIIRDQSAQRTIGGGRVIDVFPPARGRAKPERLKWLNAMSESEHAAALAKLLTVSETGIELARFAQNRNLTDSESADIESQADARVVIDGQDRIAFSSAQWARLSATVRSQIAKWHAATPDVAGLSENRILDGTGTRINRRWAAAIAAELVRDGVLARAGAGVRIPTHSAKLQGEDAKLWKLAEASFSSAGLRPITAREIAQDCRLELRKTEAFLTRAGRLGLVIRISKTRFSTPDQLMELAAIAEKLARADSNNMLMVAEFRDASGVGRNMTIEILEYFDRQKFTRRVGEGRKVVQAADKATIIR